MELVEQSSRQAVWTCGHPSILWTHGAILPRRGTTKRAEHEQGQHRSPQNHDHGAQTCSLDRNLQLPRYGVAILCSPEMIRDDHHRALRFCCWRLFLHKTPIPILRGGTKFAAAAYCQRDNAGGQQSAGEQERVDSNYISRLPCSVLSHPG